MVMLAVRVVGGSGATYPFLPQLPFMQLEYKWGETGTPSSGWPMALSAFPQFHNVLQNSYLILLPGVATVVENISAPPIKVLKVSKANM